MISKRTLNEFYEFLRILLYLAIIIGLALLIYRLVVLPAPEETGALPEQGPSPSILDKLGPQTSVAIIVILMALVAWVFYLFIQFGRRLAMRGYLGPLARDAVARAEFARREADLIEDLKTGGLFKVNVKDEEWRKRYRIPTEAPPPQLSMGVEVNQYGCPLIESTMSDMVDYELISDRLKSESELYTGKYSQQDIQSVKSDEMKVEHWDGDKLWDERDKDALGEGPISMQDIINVEIDRRFIRGYVNEQVHLYDEKRAEVRTQSNVHAEAMVPKMDVSAFGGGWIFVLEFTTIIFIIFAALSLGFMGVLEGDHIATILAAIAGYVLGKSTTIRGSGGEEIQRQQVQAEAIKPVMDTMKEQTKLRIQSDEEKVRLKREIEDLKAEVQSTKILVPGDLRGRPKGESESRA